MINIFTVLKNTPGSSNDTHQLIHYIVMNPVELRIRIARLVAIVRDMNCKFDNI